MAITASYGAPPRSMPMRSNSRPRSVSMADYTPLYIDREALSSAYHAAISTTPSSTSGYTQSSQNYSAPPSTYSGTSYETPGPSSPSTLSHHLKPGDNPHLVFDKSDPSYVNQAGVGAGHSLTPGALPFNAYPSPASGALPVSAGGNGTSLDPVPPTPPREARTEHVGCTRFPKPRHGIRGCPRG
ncbi:hypothetical protein BD324DRAFT_621578 [Kockovaella imperatae]|uniref:Uncharacterized protein n=1 Tax=Kockovaella imperatae TaxID=4999 RepID=A0A1Y1UKW0_9TREE|nr:hypothetical protein BD324DRAFT_621578 [Kockovaella imperatae]ORX38612.1 hypothetical protein BD324DRAFT_621578 [Kockovaella imperatae]